MKGTLTKLNSPLEIASEQDVYTAIFDSLDDSRYLIYRESVSSLSEEDSISEVYVTRILDEEITATIIESYLVEKSGERFKVTVQEGSPKAGENVSTLMGRTAKSFANVGEFITGILSRDYVPAGTPSTPAEPGIFRSTIVDDISIAGSTITGNIISEIGIYESPGGSEVGKIDLSSPADTSELEALITGTYGSGFSFFYTGDSIRIESPSLPAFTVESQAETIQYPFQEIGGTEAIPGDIPTAIYLDQVSRFLRVIDISGMTNSAPFDSETGVVAKILRTSEQTGFFE